MTDINNPEDNDDDHDDGFMDAFTNNVPSPTANRYRSAICDLQIEGQPNPHVQEYIFAYYIIAKLNLTFKLRVWQEGLGTTW
jgi:hypothetical protein